MARVPRPAPPVIARSAVWISIIVVALLVTMVTSWASEAQAADDPTTTRKARTSQQHRATIDLKTWQASRHGKAISWRESHDVCRAVSPDGRHRGKWQMSRPLWRDYGGRKFARVANRATCKEQDLVARRVWVDQWWWPWGG